MRVRRFVVALIALMLVIAPLLMLSGCVSRAIWR